MTIPVLILVAVVAIGLVSFIAIYNSLVSLRNKVREAYSTMDVFLRKRHDLIPMLVTTVKGYAAHEVETLENVTARRMGGETLSAVLDTETRISYALSKVMVSVEGYPDLKADTTFLDLQRQIVKVEDDIACARRYYNGSVREYNNRCETVPYNFVARLAGHRAQPMFRAADDERSVNDIVF